MNIQTIEGLGYKILITEYITKDVQRRTHKKKRINKKWLKRYGIKIIPDNTKILLVNNTLMMTGKCYEKLRKFADKDADSMEKFLKEATKKQSQ
ncbi:hypothetical protein LIP66_02155 [Coprococcus eutactus]|jgi:hypothetical protein|uniref:hypothetical protein n=1 Tax=Coprococcus eutactus TaxID=33043 RepID=UPI001570D133|nr:hypothetical protein [Coprococcus eutactus]MCB5503445.1 hypothetical protein [Coprococcus eutactus]NSC95267.1 hypothetical protein [Coprococcus eutactus]NSD34339.1 hypothetical protein [Coprococcus eutactus]